MSTTPEDIRAVLIRARALIENPDRWIKHSLHESGCYCAVGAVLQAHAEVAPEWEVHEATWQLRQNIEHPYACFGMTLSFYNYLPTTTHADILALFDRAIAA